jgi:hypothetical protein
VGLVLSSGWILGKPSWGSAALIGTICVTVAVCLRTRIGPLWLIAAGGVVGAWVGPS